MLLSMVIARFSRSVSQVAESIDGAFKLKFAQLTYASLACLQETCTLAHPDGELLAEGEEAEQVFAPVVRPMLDAETGSLWAVFRNSHSVYMPPALVADLLERFAPW